MTSFGFWSKTDDGSGHYRAMLAATSVAWLRPEFDDDGTPLTKRPHSVVVSARLDKQLASNDVVVGARVAHHDAMPGWRQLRELPGKTMVLDLDDDYFHIDPSNAVAYDYWVNGKEDGKVVIEGGFLPNLRESIELSDVVTVCSEGLAESISKTTKHPNIKVVENALDAAINGIPRDYDPELLTIGWTGTANTAAWLPMIKDVINKAAKDEYDRRVFVEFIGAPASYISACGFRLRKSFGRAIEFIHEPDQYLSALRRIDILLAPYRSTAFTEAKFPTKALEAGMLGIPLIASAIRPYAEWIEHGVNGFLVPNNKQYEWGRYTSALIQDATLRRKMGLAARARASANTMQGYLGEAWEKACLD